MFFHAGGPDTDSDPLATHEGDLRSFSGAVALVTGGCGFIGSHLVEALVASGAQVHVLDNLTAGLQSNLLLVHDSVEIEVGDVRNAACVRAVLERCQPDYIFHLAANASVPGSVRDPAYDFETNSGGTFNVLSEVRALDRCKAVVLASSGAVYGQPNAFPISEQAAIDPISPYGSSKAGAELTARTCFRVYGTPVVIARIFNAYGPRMARFVLLDFLQKLQHDPTVLEILGDGQQTRDFTYVSDTVKGLMLLALKGCPAEAYNLSSGHSVTVTELGQRLIAHLGLTECTRITYTGASWPGDAHRWEVSIDKIAQLGYMPSVDLQTGLARTIDWFRSRG